MLAAAPYVSTSSALGAPGVPPASERVAIGHIGVGGRGGGIGRGFPGSQSVAVCDCWKNRRDGYLRGQGKVYADFRDLLAASGLLPNEAVQATYDEMLRRVRAIPGVEGAALAGSDATSLLAASISSFFSGGVTRASMPTEIPARVA